MFFGATHRVVPVRSIPMRCNVEQPSRRIRSSGRNQTRHYQLLQVSAETRPLDQVWPISLLWRRFLNRPSCPASSVPSASQKEVLEERPPAAVCKNHRLSTAQDGLKRVHFPDRNAVQIPNHWGRVCGPDTELEGSRPHTV